MDEYLISKMTMEDIEQVLALESALIQKTSYEKIAASIESQTLSYYVLKKSKSVVGFYEVSIISPEAELYDIAISERLQRKGLSKLLMEHLISLCREKAVSTIFLEVNSINTKAISLYKKFGFVPYATRKNYYGDNDAILMKLEI